MDTQDSSKRLKMINERQLALNRERIVPKRTTQAKKELKGATRNKEKYILRRECKTNKQKSSTTVTLLPAPTLLSPPREVYNNKYVDSKHLH